MTWADSVTNNIHELAKMVVEFDKNYTDDMIEPNYFLGMMDALKLALSPDMQLETIANSKYEYEIKDNKIIRKEK